MTYIQIIINSLIIGGIYALFAIGFSFTFRILNFFNFFYGALFLVTPYIIFELIVYLHLSFIYSCLISISITTLVNLIVSKNIFSPLSRNSQHSSLLLIVSFMLLFLSQNMIILFVGADVKNLKKYVHQITFTFHDLTITAQQMLIILLSLSLMVFFYFLINRTLFGLKIKAVSYNFEISELRGINSQGIIMISCIISSLLASLAGILISIEQNIEPGMGLPMMLKGIAAALLGGEMIYASVIGAYAIGLLENLSIWFFPSGFKSLVLFCLLIVIIIVKQRIFLQLKLKKNKK